MSRILSSSKFAGAMIVLTILSWAWTWQHNDVRAGSPAVVSAASIEPAERPEPSKSGCAGRPIPKMARVSVSGYGEDQACGAETASYY